MLARCSVWLR